MKNVFESCEHFFHQEVRLENSASLVDEKDNEEGNESDIRRKNDRTKGQKNQKEEGIENQLENLEKEKQILEIEVKKLIGRNNYLKTLETEKVNGKGEGKEETSEEEERSCGICCDDFQDKMMLTFCGHVYCEDCLTAWIPKHHTCPFCMSHIGSIQELTRVTLKRKTIDEEKNQIVQKSTFGSSSNPEIVELTHNPALDDSIEIKSGFGTKIDALVRYLLYLKQTQPLVKSLVFSQWEQVLKIIMVALEQNELGFVRLEGSGKGSAVLQFRNDPELRVFLLNSSSQVFIFYIFIFLS